MALRTVSNTGGNWNATTSWVGGVVPIAGDDVNFTATSGNLTVNVSTANLVGINFTNYVGTITFNNPINTNGTVNLGTGGYTQDGTNGLVINGTATISGSAIWSRTLTFTGTSITYTLGSNLTVTGTISLSGITASTFNGNTLNIGGSLTVTTAATVSGTTAFVFNGTGTWSHTAAGVIRNNVTINTAGTLTIGTNIYYDTGTLTYTAGTVTTTGSTLNIATSTTLNTKTVVWSTIITTGTTTLTLTGNLNTTNLTIGTGTLSFTLGGFVLAVSGNLSINASQVTTVTFNVPQNLQVTNLLLGLNSNGGVTLNGLFTISVSGNLTQAHSSSTTSGTTSILLNGTGTWSSTYSSAILRNNLTINTVGTITITGNVYYTTGTLAYTTGTVTTTGSTLNINAATTLNTSGMTWGTISTGNPAFTLTLTSNLNIVNLTTSSALTVNGLFNINISGNLTVGNGITGTSSIILIGTGTWSQSGGTSITNNLTINTVGTITIGTNVYYSTGTLLYIAGIVNTTTNSSILNINASTTLSIGIITWNSLIVTAAATITLGANLKVLTQFTLSGGGYILTIIPGIYSVDFSTANVTIGTVNAGAISFIYTGTINCVNFRVLAGNGYSTTLTGTTYNINGNFTIDTPGTSGSVTGTSTINLIGTGIVQQLNSGIYAVPVTNNFTINTTGTITFLSGTRFFYQTGIFTYIAGTVITTNVIFGILGSCTLDTDRGLTQIDWTNITSYTTSTITLSSNLNITNLTISSGTLSFTIGVNNLLISGNLTINSGCGFNTPQNLQVVNLILGNSVASPLTINGLFTISVSGNLTQSNSTQTVSGATTIQLNGTGTWSNVSTGILANNLIINTVNTITIGVNVYYSTGTLSYLNGTVNTTTNNSTLNIPSAATLNTGILIWNNVLISASNSTITLTGNLTIGGTFSVTALGVLTITGLFNININGNFTNGVQTAILGTSSVIFGGTGTWSNVTFTGYLGLSTTINTIGTLTISGNVYYGGATLIYTTGTVDTTTNNSTLNISTSTTLDTDRGLIKITWNNITIAAGTTTLSSNLTISTTFTITGTITGSFTVTTLNLTTGSSAINVTSTSVSGNLTINGSTSGTSPITLNGTGNQTWSHGSAVYLSNNLIINKSLGTLTIGTNVYYQTGTLTYTAGTVNTTSNSSTLNINTTTLNTSGITWYNVTITTGTISLTSNFIMSNLLTIGTTSNQTITFSGVGVLSPTITCDLLVSTNSINTTLNLPYSITVNNFTYSVSALGSTGFFTLNNNTINILGNLSLIQSGLNIGGGIIGNGSLAMIGTGTWSSTYQPFQSSGTWYNFIAVNIIFNTTGVITITNSVAISFRNDGIVTTKTITYISGEINATSSILWILDSAIQSGIVFNTNTLMWGSIYIARNVGASSSYNNITLLSDLNISGTLYFFDGNFSNSLGFIVNGLYNINMASLVVSSGGGVLTGNATFVFNKTGTWVHGTGVSVSNNIIINTLDTLTISGNVYYNSRTITYIKGKVITKNSTLNLTAACTLINCHKINFDRVVITSGVNITMNEFFNGLPNFKSNILPSSTTNYTITFQDGFEKFAKFIKLSRATISRPNQLTVITDKGNQGNNVGVKFAPNQLANGLPKNTSTTSTVTPYGLQPSYLVTDPTLS